ncbi:M20/M25/M40 family metallo-hydrolase [Paenarthrobacter sp. Z7-10]|uniref:M20/M25/M40 family metallo-hydrolase n=1 Tax=Paenarthrobacter sp. Z7-10 TaxID=2787635 RepID=UPI0022A92157|nr:M20/M25/M40 family metallo-hydrolase [Paenarthrobacter sp. Z7-10]
MHSLTGLPAWIDEHRQEILSDLTHYVSLESPSDDKPLLGAALTWLEGWLTERLGKPAARRRVDGGERGDTLVVDYPAPGGDDWVTALCHYDTVWSAGTLAGWPASIQGDNFSGPGAFDMKGGLVQLVWALKACEVLRLPRPSLRLVLNGDEEIGSPASRAVIEEEVVRGSSVLVFEASSNGAVKTARKGVGIFRVDAIGEEAHAGLDPEAGASAIDEISRVVLDLHGAADLDRGTSLNVGILKAGTRTNVKAGRATADVDVRVASDDEMRRVDAVFAGLAPHNPRAEITVSGGVEPSRYGALLRHGRAFFAGQLRGSRTRL